MVSLMLRPREKVWANRWQSRWGLRLLEATGLASSAGDLGLGRVGGNFCPSREEGGTPGRGWSTEELIVRDGWA